MYTLTRKETCLYVSTYAHEGIEAPAENTGCSSANELCYPRKNQYRCRYNDGGILYATAQTIPNYHLAPSFKERPRTFLVASTSCMVLRPVFSRKTNESSLKSIAPELQNLALYLLCFIQFVQN